jgi:hypothetical protein
VLDADGDVAMAAPAASATTHVAQLVGGVAVPAASPLDSAVLEGVVPWEDDADGEDGVDGDGGGGREGDAAAATSVPAAVAPPPPPFAMPAAARRRAADAMESLLRTTWAGVRVVRFEVPHTTLTPLGDGTCAVRIEWTEADPPLLD